MIAANDPAPLALELPDQLLDVLADRVAERLADRQPSAEDGWLRGGGAIADYLGCPRSRVYALTSCNPSRIPIHRDGSALIALRSELDQWVRAGGGKRP